MQKINLLEKFNQINDYWNPRIAGELNNQQIKLVKLKGDFVWHHHANEDELFYVVKGNFMLNFRDESVQIMKENLLLFQKEKSISLLRKMKFG